MQMNSTQKQRVEWEGKEGGSWRERERAVPMKEKSKNKLQQFLYTSLAKRKKNT
jgi:hypothetical protein